MAQDKKKKTQQTMTDPMLEGTGQPGALYGAPEKASDEWIEAMKAAEAEEAMKAAGISQDPSLEGTGQPGEQYMTPGSPEFENKMEKLEQQETSSKYDDAKEIASNDIGPEFKGMFWLRSIDPRLDIEQYSPSVINKLQTEEV